MTDKKLPECIYVREGNTQSFGRKVPKGPHAKYVRSDLAASDASEPLVHGQFRWAMKKIDPWNVGWFVVVIRDPHPDSMLPGMVWHPTDSDYTTYSLDELSKIGPVIHPPAY